MADKVDVRQGTPALMILKTLDTPIPARSFAPAEES